MELNISELLDENIFLKELELKVKDEGFYYGGEYIKLLQPMNFNGTLSKAGDIFELKGRLHSLLQLTCSRCSEKFPYAVDIPIAERFTNSSNGDEELIFIDGDIIDITEILENNIILSLPIKRLCREDCRGLCQKCGTNLNYSECHCKDDDIDPRLAKLKDMFFTD
ncbi:YceD family protein [Clostridium luticellarii]|jgi:uncharacterized protein|uniref:Large ribosomal RNA subunit accumulation protein YceD n=1 Tax=Clostridium luticellarii TaxID=1691940 RepID=A0A2T0BRC4_9CLOT|nr:DUF177 domain-containing protein [Clostridium luticellarii]MCI1943876.1 DUF177 domain-containing protein [Clostridium luticellarii]MCI1967137.1 DUF177 domain-containing protein [Clostridium luticellarii]MCI1994504.1 DUF177 domain-containing protein [Clostridium luticellarii]MCI2038543.1 DUF177 domain-containing protein [Clostridium luticellarii]PRR86418.1 hypothetical protein CLLU_05160 [Clostridium luticellarii]